MNSNKDLNNYIIKVAVVESVFFLVLVFGFMRKEISLEVLIGGVIVLSSIAGMTIVRKVLEFKRMQKEEGQGQGGELK